MLKKKSAVTPEMKKRYQHIVETLLGDELRENAIKSGRNIVEFEKERSDAFRELFDFINAR